MFEQTFKNIDDALRRDDGCGSELDYVEQSSWILFLKYLDDLEETRKMKEEAPARTPAEILAEMKSLENENLKLLSEIEALIK